MFDVVTCISAVAPSIQLGRREHFSHPRGKPVRVELAMQNTFNELLLELAIHEREEIEMRRHSSIKHNGANMADPLHYTGV